MPWSALKIFPGVNASMLVGPYLRALMGSMSPSKSSDVKSGLPCTLMNRSGPVSFLFVLPSLTVMVGRSLAIFLARVVLPIPGGPRMMTCLPMRRALLSCCLVCSWPRISVNGSSFRNMVWKCFFMPYFCESWLYKSCV